MGKVFGAFIFFFLSGFVLLNSQQSGKKTIAVLEFQSTGGIEKSELMVLTNRFRGILVQTQAFEVLERDKMKEILKEQDFMISDQCNTKECAVQVGQLLGVELMIAGDIGKIGQMYTVDLRMIQVETGKIMQSKSEDYEGKVEGLLGVMKTIAQSFVAQDSRKTTSSLTEFGDLYIISVPPKAEIFIDGKSTGLKTPKLVEGLSAGIHTIELRTNDLSAKKEVEIKKNAIENLNLELKRILKPVKVVSEPQESNVYINGKEMGKTPTILNLSVGAHIISVRKEGYQNFNDTLILSESENNQTIKAVLKKICKLLVKAVPPPGLKTGEILVYINDRRIANNYSYTLTEGSYQLKIKTDLKEIQEYTKDLVISDDLTLSVNLLIDSAYVNEIKEKQLKEAAIINKKDSMAGEKDAKFLKQETNPKLDMIDNGTLSNWVFIDSGTFLMGNSMTSEKSDECPQHLVKIKGFFLSRFEITVGEYKQFCKETGRKMPFSPTWGWQDNHPMVNVSWKSAKAYCKWLSAKIGRNIRLPYEAEWEYAASDKGKADNLFYQNNINDFSWFIDNSKSKTNPVGTKIPNSLGVYDMLGNVWEWCEDWYSPDYYYHSVPENAIGPETGTRRVLRGGSYFNKKEDLNLTLRHKLKPDVYYENTGFRVVMESVMDSSITLKNKEIKFLNSDLSVISGKRIKIKSEPSDGKIYINNIIIGTTPFDTILSNGNHQIKVAKEGYSSYVENIAINKEDSNLIINAILKKLHKITFEKNISQNDQFKLIKIFLDDKEIPVNTKSYRIEPGIHKIRFITNYPGMENLIKTINVSSDTTVNVFPYNSGDVAILKKKYKVSINPVLPDDNKIKITKILINNIKIPTDSNSYLCDEGSCEIKILTNIKGIGGQENFFLASDTTVTVFIKTKGILTITSEPTGGKIYINNVLSGQTPGEFNITNEKTYLKIIMNGYEGYYETIDNGSLVSNRAIHAVLKKLYKVSVNPILPDGIKTKSVKIMIDSKELPANDKTAMITEGQHTLIISTSSPNMEDYIGTIEVCSDTTFSPTLQKK